MTFRLPSPAAYVGSLLIAAPIAYVLYWTLQTQNLTGNSLIVLATGLFIGHLTGVCSRSSATHTSAQTATQSGGAITGDTISLYVGNLAYRAQRSEIHDLFSRYGHVNSVRIMTDRATHRPRGYAFVEMESSAAREALNQLDNTEFAGRNLKVSEAKQRKAE